MVRYFVLIHEVSFIINRGFGDTKEMVADRLHAAGKFIKVHLQAQLVLFILVHSV